MQTSVRREWTKIRVFELRAKAFRDWNALRRAVSERFRNALAHWERFGNATERQAGRCGTLSERLGVRLSCLMVANWQHVASGRHANWPGRLISAGRPVPGVKLSTPVRVPVGLGSCGTVGASAACLDGR
jgi:hypothetical protein